MAKHKERAERRKAARVERAKRCFDAHHRYARMSAYKVRLVVDQVRGMGVGEAMEQLQFSNRRAAAMLNKVVHSALANAEHRISEQELEVDIDRLYLADVHVGEGPTLKRWMTRARGMAYPILKRTCHISVTLSPRPDEGGDEEQGGDAAARGAGAKGKAGGAKQQAKAAAAAGAS